MMYCELRKVALTKGFSSLPLLNRHYGKHAHKFGVVSPEEYEARADIFLGAMKAAHVFECKRKFGDILRFDPTTEEYGVLDVRGAIRTYFKPVPCSQVPATIKVAVQKAGECHNYADNIRYFRSECARY